MPGAPPPDALLRPQGLRLHDNAALLAAAAGADALCPLFILDPWFLKPDKCGGEGGAAAASSAAVQRCQATAG